MDHIFNMSKKELINYLAFGVAFFATAISLVFSEILKYPPCSLCWYQRVFMYSLAIVIPTGIVVGDKNKLSAYIVVLSAFGLVISGYHSLIYHGIIEEALTLCTADLSCKTKQFELFGLISIPVMSLLSFVALLGLGIKGSLNEERN